MKTRKQEVNIFMHGGSIFFLVIVGIIAFIFLLFRIRKYLSEKEEEKMKSWLNRNKSELLTSWGAPTLVFPIENGKELWSYQRIRQTSGYTHNVSSPHSLTRIEVPQQYIIKRDFFIDENGIIYNYRWENL
ncbi:MAG: hypothetical protein LBQ93_06060 [Treponema sp.]|jgi:hypothetical protein|nr:hypothetical protein [Treponema sp.]